MPAPGAGSGGARSGSGMGGVGFTGDEPDWEGAAAAADQDVGMAGGGPYYANDPNAFNVRAGPDIPMGYNPDVIAAIAAQLDAAAESGGGAPYNPAVVNEDDLVGRVRAMRQAEEERSARMQAQIAAMEAQRNWTGGFNPELDSHPADWENVTRGMNPVGSMMPIVNEDATPTSYYGNEWGMPDARLDERSRGPGNVSDQDFWGQQTMDPTARRDWQIQNPSPLASSRAGPIASHFPSPLASSIPGGQTDDYGMTFDAMDRARQMGDIDTIMAQQEAQREVQRQSEAASQFDPKYFNMRPGHASKVRIGQEMPRGFAARLAGGPQSDDYGMNYFVPGGGPTPSQAEDAIGPPGIGGNNFYGMVTDTTPDVSSSTADEAEERAWSFMSAEDLGKKYLKDGVTARDLVNATNKSKLDEAVTDATKTLSKKLTKDDKKANVAARRKAERDYVDYRDILNENVKDAKTVLAKTIKDHGKKSDEAKKAKKDLRVAQEDLMLWENSDLYIKSYGTVKRPGWGHNWPVIGTPLKVITSIEDYFHSLGKTERRDPKEVLQDMKDNPEKYTTKGEVSNANLIKNMYPFLKSAPTDVAAAAATEPAYLRYLMNLNVNKQPIPKFYSPNWRNDVSDAWIYG